MEDAISYIQQAKDELTDIYETRIDDVDKYIDRITDVLDDALEALDKEQ